MKKALLIALMVLVATTSVFATTQFKFNIGVQNTGLGVEVIKPQNIEAKTNFNFALDTETNIFFKDGLGINLIVGTEKFEAFDLAVGFAYNHSINPNWDFVVSVGPAFRFTENRHAFGMFAHFDFDFLAGKTFFARLGTGLDMEFVQFGGKGGTTNTFVLSIPIPRVAIGWKF